MPRDANGNTQPLPGTIVQTGDTVLPSQHNPALVDLYAMMTDSLARSGQGGMLANLNFSTFKGINLANGTAAADAVNKSQLDALITYPTANNSFRVGNILIQFVSQGVTLNGSGESTVLFPTAYTNVPIVLVQNSAYTINGADVHLKSVPSLAGFQFSTSPSTPSALIGINWISIGNV